MAWFFTDENITSDTYVISGENARHISKSLRMKKGEELTLVTPDNTQCECVLTEITAEYSAVKITEKRPCENEPDVFVTLYQALPKGDKMDYIVQKCVELGISRIVPMLSARCVSRPDAKSIKKKCERWQKIALQAAMQSRRGIIPQVSECVSFEKAAQMSLESEKQIIFYELGGEKVNKILDKKPKSIAMFIGSEGGFEQSEVDKIIANGGSPATLGKRILRAETAPLAALSIIMFQTDNF
ncbi:16S rRNA (uracil(1498)-N(3))-methyltransferase [Ruminococcus intestinalis]|uniref:16S rRNA (uracil(1498)-N(3))-methyltransferase n=1 Tax=Ruminococcus intestinalis TaxID=2763066 RepID=UPI003F7F6626